MNIIILFVSVLNFMLGIFILSHNKRLPHYFISIFSMLSGIWILLVQLAFLFNNVNYIYVAFYIPIIGLATLLNFSYTLNKQHVQKVLPYLIFIPAIFILITSTTTLVIGKITLIGHMIVVYYGPYIMLHKFFILIYTILILYLSPNYLS